MLITELRKEENSSGSMGVSLMQKAENIHYLYASKAVVLV